MLENIRQFVALNEEMHTVIDKVLAADTIPESDKWKTIYELVFSDSCSRKAWELHDFDWCDPDANYEDDVKAFVSAFDQEVEKLKCLL